MSKPLSDEVVCDFSDLPQTSCAHCRPDVAELDERSIHVHSDRKHRGRTPFNAQHEGSCDSCGYPIEVGDQIVALNESYIHWGCR
jgi:hypothetical protein